MFYCLVPCHTHTHQPKGNPNVISNPMARHAKSDWKPGHSLVRHVFFSLLSLSRHETDIKHSTTYFQTAFHNRKKQQQFCCFQHVMFVLFSCMHFISNLVPSFVFCSTVRCNFLWSFLFVLFCTQSFLVKHKHTSRNWQERIEKRVKHNPNNTSAKQSLQQQQTTTCKWRFFATIWKETVLQINHQNKIHSFHLFFLPMTLLLLFFIALCDFLFSLYGFSRFFSFLRSSFPLLVPHPRLRLEGLWQFDWRVV